MPTPAEAIAQELRTGGYSMLSDPAVNLPPHLRRESLFLDFKQNENERDAGASSADYQKLAEAISGFANAE